MSVVDALGKTCPQPVIMTSKELDALAAAGRSAEAVEVLVDNMVAVENLKRLAGSRKRGVEIAQEEPGARWRVVIAGGEPGDETPAEPFEPHATSRCPRLPKLPARSSPWAASSWGAATRSSARFS